MGELMPLAPVADAGRLIVNPHPVLLDGRTNVPADLRPGETLYAFLSRHVDLSEQWEVRIGGEVVPVEQWMRVKPKHGQHIEVVHAVNRQALQLVAMIALTYFTMGAGATWAAGWGLSAAATSAVYAGAFVAGSILINKVLGPKMPEPANQARDSVYSITSARNQMRPYDPVALLFGHTRITPDLASMPYIWHEGDDQYLGMVLNVGANVHDVGDIYHGDGLLSAFDGVQVYYNNIPGKPDQTIPLYSNADTIEGGELEKTTAWVQRTTPVDTVRIQLNIEGQIGDQTSKGKFYRNAETIQAEYRPVGSSTWQPLASQVISNDNDKNYQIQRVTLSRDVAEGQYDVRVRRLYTAQDKDKGSQYWSAESQFQWTTMVAVQSDNATYEGMGRIGIRVRATGQLSGALDQLRMEAWSRPVPVWNGTAWVTETTSNPGALILQFLRGIHDENGRIIAGLGLDEDEIDIPSLQAFMVHCAAEGYQYNHCLRDVRNNGDQLAAMARAGFGAMSWESGRWGVVWAADGQPVSGVVNMATIKRGQFQVDYTLAQAADGIEYTYLDSSDWQVKTLRVPAPGVDTMLNPATVQAEGVSTEAHAAQMARWHLAQSMYQYKDIVFSTDLEQLAYKRMDVLQLQHDLTQWGYGGRLVSVDGDVLTLDEPVPGNSVAWIGIRIPGESVYRTLRVQAFEGESDTITLLDSWPSDAPLPSAENPAHDHIWIYDFKATPGYRVRVVGKELESDAKGASVAVVPEGPEFWNYVKTGEYIPPQPGSLLDTRPKASNVAVSEVQVVTGDVVHTELAVTFDLKGPAARTVIFAGIQGSEIGPVAETVTQTARFRIGSAGTYTIVVRPYNADGIAGESATVTYTTEGADIPPPPFDWASVEVGQSGLRRYAWGYYQFQPADLAGAEIRFMPGTVADPDWEAMTPLGADGFFTAAFETDTPAAGEWTFAFAAINTAGDLSAPVIIHATLAENVGEHLEDHADRIDLTEQELIDQQAAIDQEIADRIAADLQYAQDAAADATAKANAALATAMAAVNALEAQVADIVGAPDWDPLETYEPGQMVKFDGGLYRALVQTTGDQPGTSPAQWEKVGDYDSLGEAVAAALTLATQTASELEAEVTRINALYARMPAGNDGLATEAMVLAEAQALASDISAEANRIDGLVARMPGGSGTLATQASVNNVENASVSRDNALAERVDLTQAAIGGIVTVANPSFESDTGWGATPGDNTLPAGATYVWSQSSARRSGNYALGLTAGVSVFNSRIVETQAGDVFYVAAWARSVSTSVPDAGSVVRIGMRAYDAGGNFIPESNQHFTIATSPGTNFGWEYGGGEYTVPDTAVGVSVYLTASTSTGSGTWLVDDVTIDRVTQTDRALASLLNTTRAEVQENSDGIAANTSQIALHTTAIAGKAETTYVQAVEGTATAAQGQAAANLTAINGLSATVGGHSASINELREVSVSTADVVILDAGFEEMTGWGVSPTSNTLPTGARYVFSTSAAVRSGERSLGMLADTIVYNTRMAPAASGDRFSLRLWARSLSSAVPSSGAGMEIGMRAYDASRDFISGSNASYPVVTSTGSNFGWTVGDAEYVAPAGTVYVSAYLRTRADTGSGEWLVDDVRVERLSETDERFRASHTVALNVNGHVSGTVSENDGQTGTFSILAQVFQLIASGSVGMEVRHPRANTYYMRFYAAGAQLVLGINFGASQNLVGWFGPNIGEAACTTANSTVHATNTGDAYFGGTLRSGILTTAMNWGLTAGNWNETQYMTMAHESNGSPKVVIASGGPNHANRLSGNQVGSYPARTATMRRRIYRGGTLIRTDSITRTSSAVFYPYAPGDPWPGPEGGTEVEHSFIFGSTTFNDNSTGTGEQVYRVVFDITSGTYYAPNGGVASLRVTEE